MSAEERSTEILEGCRSFSGDAFLTANYTDDSISRGYGYQCRRVLTIPNTGTYKIVFDARGVASNKGVFILPIHMYATGGPCLIKTYSIASYTGGTQFPSNYINYTNRIAPGGVIKHGITSTDTPGDDLREYLLGADGTPATSRAGEAHGAVPIVLPKNAVMIMEIDNNYSGDVQFLADILWFEVLFG